MAITPQTYAPGFTYPELLCTLRHMRARRDATWRERLELEEQTSLGCNDERRLLLLAAADELDLMDGAIRCMWREVLKPL